MLSRTHFFWMQFSTKVDGSKVSYQERGALLPDDEALLANAWALVDRTLYEAVEVRAGEGLVVRDLRTADLIEVRERAFSRQSE